MVYVLEINPGYVFSSPVDRSFIWLSSCTSYPAELKVLTCIVRVHPYALHLSVNCLSGRTELQNHALNQSILQVFLLYFIISIFKEKSLLLTFICFFLL